MSSSPLHSGGYDRTDAIHLEIHRQERPLHTPRRLERPRRAHGRRISLFLCLRAGAAFRATPDPMVGLRYTARGSLQRGLCCLGIFRSKRIRLIEFRRKAAVAPVVQSCAAVLSLGDSRSWWNPAELYAPVPLPSHSVGTQSGGRSSLASMGLRRPDTQLPLGGQRRAVWCFQDRPFVFSQFSMDPQDRASRIHFPPPPLPHHPS